MLPRRRIFHRLSRSLQAAGGASRRSGDGSGCGAGCVVETSEITGAGAVERVAGHRPRGDDAMKLDAKVDGLAAKFESNGARFRYERNGEAVEREYSIAALAPGSFSVLIEGRSYSVVWVEGSIRVNGRPFAVEVFDPREMRGHSAGAFGEGRRNIASPMPGKVVRVLVSAGDAVEAGQGLVVVEAMKMQNEMKSPKAGKVVEVKAKADATVQAGEVLVVIE